VRAETEVRPAATKGDVVSVTRSHEPRSATASTIRAASSSIRDRSDRTARGVKRALSSLRYFVCAGGSAISIISWSSSTGPAVASRIVIVGDDENTAGSRPTALTSW
jgi:hypothetical protein